MKQTEDVISCLPEHVERGISKYGGQKDLHLQAVIKAAGYEYVPYVFNDNRVLLILPKKTHQCLKREYHRHLRLSFI